ncbi:MAG: hypothetical protein LQ344_000894 [Seirophora lacunosa]|nr:MAG: hypothetical protein LQ344_000894 [Seirophora lacunosa]
MGSAHSKPKTRKNQISRPTPQPHSQPLHAYGQYPPPPPPPQRPKKAHRKPPPPRARPETPVNQQVKVGKPTIVDVRRARKSHAGALVGDGGAGSGRAADPRTSQAVRLANSQNWMPERRRHEAADFAEALNWMPQRRGEWGPQRGRF